MSLFGGIRSAVSGLFTQSQSLGMIADNIANVNTTGYKGLRPRFSTLVTTQATPTLHSPGGVQSKVLRDVEAQGLLQAATASTDIAISGAGFFTVNSAGDGSGETLFTRAGSFRADLDGNLVNTGGFFLMGFPIVSGVVQQTNILSQLDVVNVANLTASPVETTSIEIGANLQASATVGDTFDLAIQVLDRQGAPETMTVTFTKNATDIWDVDLIVSNSSLLNGGALDATTRRIGQATFNADGTLAAVNNTGSTMDGTVTADADGWTFDIDYDNVLATDNTANRVKVTLDLGTVNTALGVTQFEGSFTPNFITQDGRQFGSLTGVTVSEDGTVTALFDNGETRDIYQVPLVTFNNPNGLDSKSGNVFQETTRSGTATIKVANTGGAGVIAPSALEASTVDIADEFTRMIITQRAFSANTRVVTTGDEMLDDLVRIIR